ncbi:hypothetical protein Pcar_3259 [Syntrophotalea carbinolica DSM 2380]|uniref:Uncharacterized protein n=1 Tax=Syntrophotalea carbinolica (strain DSM 2380 / NBRC 103641 / GraBd1) TaxID=338963 RepID=Q0C6Q8_SYNC1|nr:hypothetical protein Pcar_3259 [Syntrophotalea carbinolica DSM 2380]
MRPERTYLKRPFLNNFKFLKFYFQTSVYAIFLIEMTCVEKNFYQSAHRLLMSMTEINRTLFKDFPQVKK